MTKVPTMFRILSIASAVLLTALSLHAQTTSVSAPGTKHTYWTSSGEWIFTSPILDVRTPGPNGTENSTDQGAIIRFSPFFNAMGMLNYDLSEHFGLFTGISIRNQGFIYDVPGDSLNRRYKFRTYNVGIPVGFKVGTMNRGLAFFGYELELPFNYKEKLFENERKEDKFNVWFSDRNESLYQSVFVGYQGPGSVTLTVRYYLTNFHNQDFEETKDGVTTKPYAGLNANILAVSLGYALFDGRKMEFKRATAEPRAMR
jgi:hypothetical protein